MMIDSQNDTSKLIQNRVVSPHKKENTPVPLVLTSSTPFTKTSHIQPQPIPGQRILQTHWLNLTTNQPNFTKVVSPKSFYATGPVVSPRQTRIIELGGSKQKRLNRQRNSSTSEAQTQGNQLSASQTLNRRVAMLESRVKQLHMQKQQLAIDMNQKNKALQAENQRLVSIIKDLQVKKTTKVANPDEFDLEEMLSNQININLELRQELENAKRQLQELKKNYSLQNNELNTVSEENVALKIQIAQLQDSSQDENNRLKEQIKNLQESLGKTEASTISIIQERQKRILELQEQNYSLSAKLSQQQSEKQILNSQLSSLNSELKSERDELSSLKSRIEQLQKPVECKKCKELLHTVFRLNSQLNRK